jgi:hypothetical protein
LGRFFVIFASVELNLSLRVGGDGNFHDKLERLLGSSNAFGDSEDAFCQISTWYMAADSMREIRNRLAHGRWGYRVHSQQVVHVSGYPPGAQCERYYSIDELHAIVRDAESLNNELNGLAR